MKKIQVCTTCGSPRVTYDALVDPNKDNEVVTIFDNSDCQNCGGECSTQEVEVSDDFDLETDFYKGGTMIEIWMDVRGYEGRYKVSNFGRVESQPNKRRRTALILKQSAHKRTGHMIVNLTSEENGKWKQKCHWVHRLVLEAFEGPCPAGMEGCHNDGNPANNHLENLRWDTDKGNAADRPKHGTDAIGENNPNAKLCLADIRIIKQRIADGESDEAIAPSFSVTPFAIKNIRNGYNWRNV